MKNTLGKNFRWKLALSFAWVLLAACGSESSPLEGNPPASNPPVETEVLQFFAFGDWGTGDDPQKQVADAVTSFCQTQHCDFGLLLGDNFYPAGVSSTADIQWQDKFE